jgi:hypothetical protein
MSTGHVHSGYPQPKPKHYEMLAELERQPWFAMGRKRPFRLVTNCDNPYVAGSSVDLADIFVDRHAWPVIKKAGLLPGTIEHEMVEGILELHDWQYMDPAKPAHLVASAAENIVNMRRGITPEQARAVFEPLIKVDSREKLKIIPITLDLKPFLDPREFDKRLLIHMEMRMTGAVVPDRDGLTLAHTLAEDFAKLPQEAVDYSPSSGDDRCGNCVLFLKARKQCQRVAGAIDADWWCRLHLDADDAKEYAKES